MSITINPIGLPSTAVVGTPAIVVQSKSEFDKHLETDLEETFYNVTEFARIIRYEYSNGSYQTLNIIFDAEGSSVDINTEVPVMTTEPMFHCNTNDFNHKPGKGDRCLIGNKWFYVKEHHPDSTGVSVVTLRKD